MRTIEALATTDTLTGLPNRRAMIDVLAGALSSVLRHGQPAVVMLIDIDHFKRINDRLGHAAGDQALVRVGRLLAAQLRPSDRVGRWGGEEFLVVAAATALPAGLELADRLRHSVAAFEFEHGEVITVSLGVTQVLPGDSADTLLARADRALYRAKDAGRNRTEAARAAPAAVGG
jgi:diguanylate cyclase (GGDEF)-like protein